MYQGELSDEILSALEENFASLSEAEELLDYAVAEQTCRLWLCIRLFTVI